MAAFQEALPLQPLPLPLPLSPPPLSLDHATALTHPPTVKSGSNPSDSSGSRIDHASNLGNGVANFVTAAAGAAVARGSRRKRGIRMKVGCGAGAGASGGSGGGGGMQQEAEVEAGKKAAAAAAVYACSQCVKQFSSPKALFGHMSCHAHASTVRFLGLDHRPITKLRSRPRHALPGHERQDDASYSSDNDSIEAAYVAAAAGGGNKKRARKKHRMTSKRGGGMHDHDLGSSLIKDEKDFVADCLVMLSSSTSTYSPPAAGRSPHKRTPSCASAANSSQDDHHDSEQEVDWLSLQRRAAGAAKYSCSTCKRVFKSHQALGGHRASHKKVKGCFARTSSSSSSKATLTTLGEEEEEEEEEEVEEEEEELDDDDVIDEEDMLPPPPSRPAAPQIRHPMGSWSSNPGLMNRSSGHECSVCHRVFATGQALGGHKRCHWVASTSDTPLPRSSNNNNNNLNSNSGGHKIHKVQQSGGGEHKQPLMLDLNLPPPDDVKASQETSASCDTTSNSSIQQQIKAWGPHSANLLQLINH